MNKAATSQGDILNASRSIILEKGIQSFSMRSVALQCNVAVGCVYNYFPSKADLLCAAIESVWEEIFRPLDHEGVQFDHFSDCISCMFDTIKKGDERYPGFFTVHSLNFASEDREKGKAMMERFFGRLKGKLMDALDRDINVRKNIFDKSLSKTKFVDYIFSLLLMILLKKEEDCTPLLELIKNCIY